MFELTTERLKIIPLNINQLQLLKIDESEFARSLGLNAGIQERFSDHIEKEISDAWHFWIEGVKKNPFNYTWYTRWEIVLKKENILIGTCGFKGLPNSNGEVEIGYMIKPSYQNKGYMTEALIEIVRYSFMHQRVKHVLAETPQDNFPSHKVLLKAGFVIFKEKEENFWWKKSRE